MSKNIIITGTSRGIGFELVRLFAEQGHKVLALSRNAKPVNDLKHENVTAFAFDLCQQEDYKNVENFIEKEWKQVDILINISPGPGSGTGKSLSSSGSAFSGRSSRCRFLPSTFISQISLKTIAFISQIPPLCVRLP